MPAYRRAYNTAGITPRPVQERRIKLPAVPRRPVRFQIRTLYRTEFIHKDPYWYTLHRRGLPGRPHVGEDPLEKRAVPHSIVHGSILERILWRYLVEVMHFVPDVDFTFQTSLQGGHQLIGGIVADFAFPYLRIILNPIGPTHDEYLRIRKDEEQNLSLEELGYEVYMVPESVIKDELRFDEYMLKVFGWIHSGGPDVGHAMDEPAALSGYDSARIQVALNSLEETIHGIR